MKIAIISDLHANLQSLHKVHQDIQQQNIEKIYCLGDVIDYGAQPEKVIQFLKKNNISTVLGNHDAALFDKEVLKWFNDTAIESSIFSRKSISAHSKDYLRSLPLFISNDYAYFVHGLPPESFEEYIYECTDKQLQEAFDSFSQNICFVGHTHTLGVYIQQRSKKIVKKDLQRSLALQKTKKYIVNVGSVGQPRDNDNRGKYIIFDTTKQRVIVRRVPYNIPSVQKRILDAGLPEENAEVLS